jgi:hypothetical protein
VIRPNLDVYTGTTGVYRRRHGNLRRDGARRVLEHALAEDAVSSEELHFPGERPTTSELAVRFGDPNGTRVYFEDVSVRFRWLDQASGGAG